MELDLAWERVGSPEWRANFANETAWYLALTHEHTKLLHQYLDPRGFEDIPDVEAQLTPEQLARLDELRAPTPDPERVATIAGWYEWMRGADEEPPGWDVT